MFLLLNDIYVKKMSRDIAGVWIFEHWDMIVISILFMFICIEAHETRNNERLLLLALCLLCTKCFFRKSESQDGWSYSNYPYLHGSIMVKL